MEIQTGEIGSKTHSMELLLPLVKKPEVRWKAVNPKGDGDCAFAAHCNSSSHSKQNFAEAEAEEGAEVPVNTRFELRINGICKCLVICGGKAWLLWWPLFMLPTGTHQMEAAARLTLCLGPSMHGAS
jgi:hypothetical protein